MLLRGVTVASPARRVSLVAWGIWILGLITVLPAGAEMTPARPPAADTVRSRSFPPDTTQPNWFGPVLQQMMLREILSQAPSNRESPAVVYDSQRDRLILFGGDDRGFYKNDVWELRLSEPPAWRRLTFRGTPPHGRSRDGAIYDPEHGKTYKSIVKLTFFKGASLKDPTKLFNSSLDGNARRAIDIHEGEKLDAKAFKALIRAAVAFNASGGKKSTKQK